MWREVRDLGVAHAVAHVRVAAERDGLDEDAAVEGRVEVDVLLDVFERDARDDRIRGVLSVDDGSVLDHGCFEVRGGIGVWRDGSTSVGSPVYMRLGNVVTMERLPEIRAVLASLILREHVSPWLTALARGGKTF